MSSKSPGKLKRYLVLIRFLVPSRIAINRRKILIPTTNTISWRLRMPKAFVLINVESGTEEDLVGELKKIEGVEEAYFSYGVYDVITKIKAESMEKLKDMVTRRIRSMSKVRSTLTLIIMDE
jgi:DNA-binding Lrp family transcriptional regulator